MSNEEKKNNNVVVFSTPTCPWCTRAKHYLHEKNITFKDVDVSRDYSAAMEMYKKSGETGVPQLWINNQVVIGFDQARINQLLGI